MATDAEILEIADTTLNGVLPIIAGVQSRFLAANGRYLQGLKSHSTTPSNGLPLAPDRAADKPSDEQMNWSAMMVDAATSGDSVPTDWRIALAVDCYMAASPGYVVHAFIIANGTEYTKSVNVGPETSRASDWSEVPQ